ncbi:tail fiber protein [Nostoc phage NMeng1]|nr:tail fiber protein [Nostoc phage NMeng1]
MALSRIVLKGTGSTNTFNVEFTLGWLNESDVTCQVAGEVDGSGNPIYRTITFVTPTQLTISGPPPGNNVDVIFTRTVPRDELLVNFNNEDIMNEDNLQLMQSQMIMLVHEVLDGRFERFDSDVDVGGFQFVNVRTPDADELGSVATVEFVNERIADNAAAATTAAASASAASASASAAGTSASAAGTSATNAAASATASAASAASAAASLAAIGDSVEDAQAAAVVADGHRAAAAASATAASGSASAASASAGNAASSATAASGSAATAGTHAGTASTKATEATNAATLAEKWAEEAEDVPVTTGPSKYSAKHWAIKAEEAAAGGGGGAGAANLVSFTPAAGILSTNVQSAIEEVVSDVDTKLAGKLDTGGTAANSSQLGGQNGAFYRNAGNLNAGVVPDAHLPTRLADATIRDAGNLNAGTIADARLPTRLGDIALDNKYARLGNVNTFTEDQVISKANASLTINGTATGSQMLFAVSGVGRMLMGIDSNGTFQINRYNSSGVLVATDLAIPHNGTPATVQGAEVITKGTKFFNQVYSTDVGAIIMAGLNPAIVATGWYDRGTQTNGSNLRITNDTSQTGQTAVNGSSLNPSLPGTWVCLTRFYLVQNNYCQCVMWVRNT